jgi:hypothetical protein
MKPVRFGPAGLERAGALIDADTIVDLSTEVGAHGARPTHRKFQNISWTKIWIMSKV